jgi:hypothetical protein
MRLDVALAVPMEASPSLRKTSVMFHALCCMTTPPLVFLALSSVMHCCNASKSSEKETAGGSSWGRSSSEYNRAGSKDEGRPWE